MNVYECFGAFLYVLGKFWTFWDVVTCCGTILEHFGMSLDILGRFGTILEVLTFRL